MKICYSIEELIAYNQSGFTAAIGNFDGIHHGHQTLIKHLKKVSVAKKLPSLIITFHPHSKVFFFPENHFLLTENEEKIELIRALKVDYLIFLQFNEELKNHSAESFVENILIDQIKIKDLVLGENFFFGRNRSGNLNMLKFYQMHFKLHEFKLHYIDDKLCASSHIKKLIQMGKIEDANELLGYQYFIEGVVIKGDSRGAQLGFPTANIAIPLDKIIPHHGVYKVFIEIEGQLYTGIANIGTRPTFNEDSTPLLEVHIFDFNQDIYEKRIKVRFIKFIRDEKKFNSIVDLVSQIKLDIENSMKI